jgi:hypothetical protein
VRRTLLAVPVAVLLLGGSGCSPFGCTDAGCESGVRFALDRNLVMDAKYRVVACVDDECAEGVLQVGNGADGTDRALALVIGAEQDTIFYRLGESQVRGTHDVSLTVHAADGELLVAWEGTAEFQRMQPNGPLCDPTCWLAEVPA